MRYGSITALLSLGQHMAHAGESQRTLSIGVHGVSILFTEKRAVVNFEDQRTDETRLIQAVVDAGYKTGIVG